MNKEYRSPDIMQFNDHTRSRVHCSKYYPVDIFTAAGVNYSLGNSPQSSDGDYKQIDASIFSTDTTFAELFLRRLLRCQ